VGLADLFTRLTSPSGRCCFRPSASPFSGLSHGCGARLVAAGRGHPDVHDIVAAWVFLSRRGPRSIASSACRLGAVISPDNTRSYTNDRTRSIITEAFNMSLNSGAKDGTSPPHLQRTGNPPTSYSPEISLPNHHPTLRNQTSNTPPGAVTSSTILLPPLVPQCASPLLSTHPSQNTSPPLSRMNTLPLQSATSDNPSNINHRRQLSNKTSNSNSSPSPMHPPRPDSLSPRRPYANSTRAPLQPDPMDQNKQNTKKKNHLSLY
jgi:hypothetical protein